MHTTQLPQIRINPNRQRQEFDLVALQELKNSIEDRGLLHPPVLRREDGQLVLVAGERRLKAISEIFELGGSFTCNGEVFADGRVPYTDLGELGHLEAEEAELDENLKRRDLTWQEHAAAVARLHALRQAQKREQIEAERPKQVATLIAAGLTSEEATDTIYRHQVIAVQSIADTAEELTGRRDGSFQDTVRKEIIVAKHLDNPAVAKAKSADEAFKILRREEQRQKNIELAKEVGASFNSEKHRIFNVNCLEWMANVENQGVFDVICTDPPYGMGADGFGDAGGKLSGIEHHYDDSYEAWLELMKAWAPLSFAVAKPQAHAYVFCDFDRFHELKVMMQAAGWYVFRTPLVVHKLNSGRVPLPDQGPRRQYELVLYAIKGKKQVTHIYPDVVTVSGDENMTHGAQKPIALYQNLLQRSVRPGDKVLDPFGGTCGTIPAGHTYQCEVTAIELNPEYYALGLKRLKDLQQTETLDTFN